MAYGIDRIKAIRNGMITRCTNEKRKDYPRYGGKGICVCKEWMGKDGAKRFVEWSLSNGYKDGLTIDRVDSAKDYSPDNCRWVTTSQQNRNRKSNHLIEYNGEVKSIVEWAESVGMRKDTFRRRIIDCGWSVEDALNTPVLQDRERLLHGKS